MSNKHVNHYSLSLAMILLLCLCTCCQAEVRVEGVGQWGGLCEAVTVCGEKAYVAIGCRLCVVDVSDPASPVVIGRTQALADGPHKIAVRGNYAYVAAGMAGLCVVDITDPSAPRCVWSNSMEILAEDVVLRGDYAYVCANRDGLKVFDVSDPVSPRLVGSYASPAFSVVFDGNYGYLACRKFSSGYPGSYSYWLEVVDLANPEAPTFAGSPSGCSPGGAMCVRGSHLFAASSTTGLAVIDISQPSNPMRVATLAMKTPEALSAEGDTLTALSGGDIKYIDVSDALHPQITGGCEINNYGPVDVVGDLVYTADGEDGLGIYDVSDATAPTRVGGTTPGERADHIVISGSHAYVASQSGKLLILDVSDRADPQLAGSCDCPEWPRSVILSGQYAYVASCSLKIVDVSDVGHPVIVGSYYPYFADISEVVVAGQYAYALNNWSEINVVDVSVATDPQPVGHCEFPDSWPNCLCRAGDRIYFADFNATIGVLDISSPTSPSYSHIHLPSASWVLRLAVSGDLLCMLGGWPQLQIVDISEPAQPRLAATWDPLHTAEEIAIDGDYVYLVTDYAGLLVIDVSDRAAPRLAGSGCIGNWPWGVNERVASRMTIADGYVYLADWGNGVVIGQVTFIPTAEAVAPRSAPNTVPAQAVQLIGGEFQPGATVRLAREGSPVIAATNVVVESTTRITCDFDLTGATPGLWDVVVTNPDGQSGTLLRGFAVTLPSSSKLVGTNGRAMHDEIMAQAAANYRFELWGRAKAVDADCFTLDDGSGSTVRVLAPGYESLGMAAGAFVSAQGTWDPGSSVPCLISDPAHITRHD